MKRERIIIIILISILIFGAAAGMSSGAAAAQPGAEVYAKELPGADDADTFAGTAGAMSVALADPEGKPGPGSGPGPDEAQPGDAAGPVDTSSGEEDRKGGGYAATGQLGGVGYSAKLYNATNGLPTSDANSICCTSDGYVWIGSYGGVIRYDGSNFERQSASKGMINGRVIFEDSRGRLWIGTNDNGALVMDGEEITLYTYSDGLPSSSVRCFAEDGDGNIYVGTSGGVSYVDRSGLLHPLDDVRLRTETVHRLLSDSEGVVYGVTKDGAVFSISSTIVRNYFSPDVLVPERITTIYADPDSAGMVYLGTDTNVIYYGAFGKKSGELKRINVSPASYIYWISKECGRVWITTESIAGYLDENNRLRVLDNIPLNNSIDMLTSDYQGNIWAASSRQGVMKLVSNNFRNLARDAQLTPEAVNATCMHGSRLYLGTDSGLKILDGKNNPVEDELTRYIGGERVRCLTEDGEGNLWISVYTGDLGLVCLKSSGEIESYTTEDGMVSNEIRCTKESTDGSILVGTNNGLSVIRDGKVIRSLGHDDGMANPMLLTVEEAEEGLIYAGTDGDGIYIISGENIKRLGRDDGLTSDVILRIKKDEARGVYWIITSNSIEYMKDGEITNVSTFPYNNNFDVYYDRNDNLWILSSNGVYCVRAQSMLEDQVSDYRLYTMDNGLTGAPTANAYSELDNEGNLYIAARDGVSRVNIDHYFEQGSLIKTGVRSLIFNDEQILPDEGGTYTIPAGRGRIVITPAILDYSMTNPLIREYLEGTEDPGITATQSAITSLEYTGLDYGAYNYHIQVLDPGSGEVYQDQSFRIVKKPMIFELLIVRILLMVLLAVAAGGIVWRVMTGTVIRRQYEEIRKAKEEADRANSAKSQFLANMSHEIRTPINTIMGMDEMILREDASRVPKDYSGTVRSYATDIKNASESLLSLINDLLDMSKIESGKMNLVEQEYDTALMLRRIIAMIRIRSQEKDLTFDVKVDEKLPVRLFGDEGKIRQIILNLLTNAVKYTEVGGFTLRVEVVQSSRLSDAQSIPEKSDKGGIGQTEQDTKQGSAEEECSLRISVKDTGIGIKSGDMEKLFTAYQRFDEEKNSAIQGTGLGLDISRRFAEMMGGSLTCESEYGKGSEFILALNQLVVDATPMGEFAEESEEDNGVYVPAFVAPDADVLVVDDNPMNLNVIKGLLKATKIFVTTASSGEECLDKLKDGSFNVVLLDHMMPGMDGIETLEHIRERYPGLPVYALTANITLGEDFYIEKGFNGYLSKPVDSRALERAIMKHLPPEIMMDPPKNSFVPPQVSLPGGDGAATGADAANGGHGSATGAMGTATGASGAAQDGPGADLEWLRSVSGISVSDGLKNSGGAENYRFSLEMFLDSLEENAAAIRGAYEDDDIPLYTIKVHALKSNARIIGAARLADMAQRLEDAGSGGDVGYIRANQDAFMEEYLSYREKLSPLKGAGNGAGDGAEESSKEHIPPQELKEALEALREVIPQMDYDAVEMITGQLSEYALPAEDEKNLQELLRLMKKLDWDGMEELIGSWPDRVG